jgi:hypothetical protein
MLAGGVLPVVRHDQDCAGRRLGGSRVDVLDVLVRFGSVGGIGLLRRGAALRDLVAVHGMPWDIGRIDQRHRWPHLYSYGDVEFVVCRCRIVTSVSVPTWRGTVELPWAETGGFQSVPVHVTYRRLVDGLAAAGCRWEPLQPVVGQSGLRTLPERIEFVFVTDEGPEPLLHGAHSWSLAHDCIDPAEAAARFPDDFPAERPA